MTTPAIVEGREYIFTTPTETFPVICERVYGTGTVGFSRYKKRGQKTPMARFKMDKAGNIKNLPELTITYDKKDQPDSKPRPSKNPKSMIEDSNIKTVVVTAWRKGNPAGWYRGMANFDSEDAVHGELIFLYRLKNTLESM